MIEINGLQVSQATQTQIKASGFALSKDAEGNVRIELDGMDPIELDAKEAPAFLTACALLTKKRIGGGRPKGAKNKPATKKTAPPKKTAPKKVAA